MRNFESGGFNFYNNEQPPANEVERSGELEDVDLRHESEVFQDHERIDNGKDIDDQLAQLRDQLSEDSDGIIHIDIPAYRYDFAKNPFIEPGPRRVKTYEISRFVDVVFLHRFMNQEIIVSGLQSRKFASEAGRAKFIKKIRETGGLPIGENYNNFEVLGQTFSPYLSFHTTDEFFRLRHLEPPRSEERPHYPIDVWLIFDVNAYEEADWTADFRQAYRLRKGFDRRASLLGLAQIN